MPFAILLGLATWTSAKLLTYLYLRDASIFARACAGVCSGTAGLGLLGFLLASTIGMKPAVAILIAPTSLLLVFLSGGFGWWTFLKESARADGVLPQLGRLTHDYSIGQAGYRWGNALTALFVPQRGMLLGLGLAVIVWTIWLQAWKTEQKQETDLRWRSLLSALLDPANRAMVFAGVLTGFLPLVHAHSFVVTMMIGVCRAALQVL